MSSSFFPPRRQTRMLQGGNIQNSSISPSKQVANNNFPPAGLNIKEKHRHLSCFISLNSKRYFLIMSVWPLWVPHCVSSTSVCDFMHFSYRNSWWHVQCIPLTPELQAREYTVHGIVENKEFTGILSFRTILRYLHCFVLQCIYSTTALLSFHFYNI